MEKITDGADSMKIRMIKAEASVTFCFFKTVQIKAYERGKKMKCCCNIQVHNRTAEMSGLSFSFFLL